MPTRFLLSPLFSTFTYINSVMMAGILFLSFHNKFSFQLCGATLLYFLLINVSIISGNSSPPIGVNQNQLGEWWIQFSVPTAFSSSSVNEKCFQHSQEYLTALRNRLPWAVQSKFFFNSLRDTFNFHSS